MIAGIIVFVIIMALILFFVSGYNKLVRQRVVVDEAFATMDVYLKQRFDLIPNLVETVKGYAGHEKSVLENVIRLRNENYSGMDMEQKIEHDAAMTRELPKVMALAENYPDLKANQNFLELGSKLQKIEEDIANARKYYNGAVRNYNIAIQAVPTNIIAGMFHFQEKKMFEIQDTAERENVQIHF
jgi:LemA protein